MCRYLLLMLLCLGAATTGSYADEKKPVTESAGAATAYLHGNAENQDLGKAFELLIKAFQAGLPEARAGLCKLQAKCYERGNIILVKKIEEHRYLNNYSCDEPGEKPPVTAAHAEQADPAHKTAATKADQTKGAVVGGGQKHSTADQAVQAPASAAVAPATAAKQEQERLAAVKAEQEKTAAAKLASARQQKAEQERLAVEKQVQERLAAVKAVKAKAAAEQRNKEKAEQERLAAEAARRAEEKRERDQLAAAIAEEERRIAAKAEQERSKAAKIVQEQQEKQRLHEAEAVRAAARKREEERAAEAKKQAAIKAEAERLAAKERLSRQRTDQVRIAANVPQAPAAKPGVKPVATGAQRAAAAATPVPKQAEETVPETSRKAGLAKHRPKPGQQVPAFNLVSSTGAPIMPEYYRGSVLVIDFFAPWCQLCRGHITNLVELHSKFKKQGLQVVGLNVDSAGREAITDFAAELHMFYPIAQADEGIQASFDVRSVPMVYVVDKKGQIAEVFPMVNSETDRALASLVKRLLREQ